MVVASLHLVRFPRRQVPATLARVPLDRRHLRAVPGARFARLLGTGAGRTMTTSADLGRWAAFMVWDGPDALASFRAADPLSQRWNRVGTERFDVTLEPLGGHGAWGGVDPTAGWQPGADDGSRDDGPVAVITRATIRARHLRTFLRAVPPVDAVLDRTDGLLATVGIGEAPIGQQATFSLWRDAAAIRAFAYRDDAHAEVVRRTHDEGWYREEWFARFRPVATSGTWDGRDPLAPFGSGP